MDALIGTQASVKGCDYDHTLDDHPGISVVYKPTNTKRSLLDYLRQREISSKRHVPRPQIVYDIDKVNTYARVSVLGANTMVNLKACDGRLTREFFEASLLAVSPDAEMLVKIRRRGQEESREYGSAELTTRVLYIVKMATSHIVWPCCLLQEDVPSTSLCSVAFSKRNGIVACITVDSGSEERPDNNARPQVPIQLRVDIFVPWAAAQISSINSVNLALRYDRNNRLIEKRCLRVHNHGVIINCGYQIIFLTVTPKPLVPIKVPSEPRLTWQAQHVRAPLGVVYGASEPLERRVPVEIGETISVRYAQPYCSRAAELSSPVRLSLREITPPSEMPTTRARGPVGRMIAQLTTPQPPSRLYVSRQACLIEQQLNEYLPKWYARQQGKTFIGFIDYEADVVAVDNTQLLAYIGVYVKAELALGAKRDGEGSAASCGAATTRNVPEASSCDETTPTADSVASTNEAEKRVAKRRTQFDVLYLSFEWHILDGRPARPEIHRIAEAINRRQVVDRNRWYRGNPRESYEQHEVMYTEKRSHRGPIELTAVYANHISVRQKAPEFPCVSQDDADVEDVELDDDDDDEQDEGIIDAPDSEESF